MKTFLALFTLCLIPVLAISQDRTLASSDSGPAKTGKFLVIPNNTTMYRCDSDREYASHNKLTVPQVRNFFRSKMAEEVWLAVKPKGSVVLLHPSDPNLRRDLEYVYVSTGFHAEPMEKTETAAKTNPVEKLFSASSTRGDDEGTRISKGEVKSPQMEDKYMKTTITNNNLLPTLNQTFGSEIFVFIGEIDILIAPGTTQQDIMNNRYNNEFRVHYTIMDKDKKPVASGVSSCLFSSRILSLPKIQEKCMRSVATDIASRITTPEH